MKRYDHNALMQCPARVVVPSLCATRVLASMVVCNEASHRRPVAAGVARAFAVQYALSGWAYRIRRMCWCVECDLYKSLTLVTRPLLFSATSL